VLFIAGGRDRTVPPAPSERLFAPAHEGVLAAPEIGHINALTDPTARERQVG
jgi:hypothetical protein